MKRLTITFNSKLSFVLKEGITLDREMAEKRSNGVPAETQLHRMGLLNSQNPHNLTLDRNITEHCLHHSVTNFGLLQVNYNKVQDLRSQLSWRLDCLLTSLQWVWSIELNKNKQCFMH